MAPKKRQKAFTSFRILSEKAQQLLQTARKKFNHKEPEKQPPPPPKPINSDEITMHISVQSVVKSAFAILAIAAGMWFFINIKDKLILIILAIFVATVIDPAVEALSRWRIPRGIAILIIYFIGIFSFSFLISSFIPIVANELKNVAHDLGGAAESYLSNPNIRIPFVSPRIDEAFTGVIENILGQITFDSFTSGIEQFGNNLLKAAQGSFNFLTQLAGSVFLVVASFVIVLVLAFFMQLEKDRVVGWVWSFLPKSYRTYAEHKASLVHRKISYWAKGQLTLCFSIFLITFIVLSILGMPYKLTLAVLAGFFEFIPVVGPFLAAVPAILIALASNGSIWGIDNSLIAALIVAGSYYLIQWTENNFLVPLIMRRAVGLSPIATISAMLIGVSFPDIIHPILGVMLAIPTTTIIAIFIEDWRKG